MFSLITQIVKLNFHIYIVVVIGTYCLSFTASELDMNPWSRKERCDHRASDKFCFNWFFSILCHAGLFFVLYRAFYSKLMWENLHLASDGGIRPNDLFEFESPPITARAEPINLFDLFLTFASSPGLEGRRHISWRSWVRILGPYTGWTFFHIYLL